MNKSDTPARRSASRRFRESGTPLTLLAVAVLLSFWLAGINTSAANENRQLAEFPTMSADTVTDASSYAAIDAAIKDRMAARNVAVSAVSDGFSSSPLSYSSQVWLGDDGEPFLADDLRNPCLAGSERSAGVQDVIAAVEAHADRAGAKGQYVLFTIAPNKSSIRRDQLGAMEDMLMQCAAGVREQLEQWGSAEGSAFLPAWNALEAAEEDSPGEVYRRGDTHWSLLGASVFVETIVDRLVADGQVSHTVLEGYEVKRSGAFTTGGDLYNLLGQTSGTEEVPDVSIVRPGVVTEKEVGPSASGRGATRWTSNSVSGAALVPGRTLVVGDSFFEAAGDLAAPFFEDLTLVISLDGDVPPELAQRAPFDRIIVSQVERGWDAMAKPYAVAGFQ